MPRAECRGVRLPVFSIQPVTPVMASAMVAKVRRLWYSVFNVGQNDSCWALFQHTPVRPTDRRTFTSSATWASWAEVYWQPLSA